MFINPWAKGGSWQKKWVWKWDLWFKDTLLVHPTVSKIGHPTALKRKSNNMCEVKAMSEAAKALLTLF